jgi:hypothetical protein
MIRDGSGVQQGRGLAVETAEMQCYAALTLVNRDCYPTRSFSAVNSSLYTHIKEFA